MDTKRLIQDLEKAHFWLTDVAWTANHTAGIVAEALVTLKAPPQPDPAAPSGSAPGLGSSIRQSVDAHEQEAISTGYTSARTTPVALRDAAQEEIYAQPVYRPQNPPEVQRLSIQSAPVQRRCLAQQGNCTNKAIKDDDYCAAHGALRDRLTGSVSIDEAKISKGADASITSAKPNSS